MTCANWGLTICSVAIIVFNLWAVFSVSVSKWITIIAALLVLVMAWTVVECKPCSLNKKK